MDRVRVDWFDIALLSAFVAHLRQRSQSHSITFATPGTHIVSYHVKDRSDGVVKSGSTPVTVGPAPSVGLSGPDVVETKGYYSYTASASGFYSPTHHWAFRNCATCGWTSLTNVGSTHTVQLTPACTSAEDRYYVEVTVRDVYGADVTRTFSTELCAADAPPPEL